MKVFFKINKDERNWLFWASGLLLAITILPYLYGYYKTPSGQSFMGIHTIDSVDTYTYLSWIEQARQNHLTFIDLYSSEKQPRVFLHPLFLFMGQMARITKLPNIFIYHGTRVLLGFGFLVILYKFISYFFDSVKMRRTAFLLTISSSGLGFLFGLYSTDLWVPESITFLSLYESVLNIFSLSIILIVFLLVLNYFPRPVKRFATYTGLLLSLLVLVHPYAITLIFPVLGVYTFMESWDKKNLNFIGNYFLMIIFSFFGFLYLLYVMNRNPILGLWANIQTNVPSPHFLYYVSGYGLLLVFAFTALFVFYGRLNKYRILIIWFIVATLLLYNPWFYRFQRKFSEGLHIPIVILATLGLTWFIIQVKQKYSFAKKFAYAFCIALLSISNIVVMVKDIKAFTTGNRPYYITTNEREGIEWLKRNTKEYDIILSGYQLGNFIPGLTGRTVFMGHNDQTVNSAFKYKTINNLFATHTNPQAFDPWKQLLKINNINYVIIDREVMLLGTDNLDNRLYLTQEYKNPDIIIYSVKKDKL